jgi:outer membrane protein assembly factor BamB
MKLAASLVMAVVFAALGSSLLVSASPPTFFGQWTVNISSNETGAYVAADEHSFYAYVSSDITEVTAPMCLSSINAATGTLRWTSTYVCLPPGSVWGMPIGVRRGRVYATSSGNLLYGLGVIKGDLQFSLALNTSFGVVNNLFLPAASKYIYIVQGGATMVAIDESLAEAVWSYENPIGTVSQVQGSETFMVMLTAGDQCSFSGMNATGSDANQQSLWSVYIPMLNGACGGIGPGIVGGTFIDTARDGGCFVVTSSVNYAYLVECVGLRTGEVMWHHNSTTVMVSTSVTTRDPVTGAEYALVLEEQALLVLDGITGSLLFRNEGGAMTIGASVLDGVVYMIIGTSFLTGYDLLYGNPVVSAALPTTLSQAFQVIAAGQTVAVGAGTVYGQQLTGFILQQPPTPVPPPTSSYQYAVYNASWACDGTSVTLTGPLGCASLPGNRSTLRFCGASGRSLHRQFFDNSPSCNGSPSRADSADIGHCYVDPILDRSEQVLACTP